MNITAGCVCVTAFVNLEFILTRKNRTGLASPLRLYDDFGFRRTITGHRDDPSC
jgi:hypothetical protein